MKPKHPKVYRIHYDPYFNKALNALQRTDYILGLDIETSKDPKYADHLNAGLQPAMSNIRLIQIAKENHVFVFDVPHLSKKEKEALLDFIRGRTFFAHAAQFEAQHFQSVGIDNLDAHCTQVMYQMLIRATNPKAFKIPARLDQVVQDLMKCELPKEHQTSDWSKDPLDPEQIEYAGRDAAYTYVLGKALLKKITKMMPKAYQLNKDMVNPLARMSRAGFYFNKKSHAKEIKHWEKEEKRLHKFLIDTYGEWNFNSGQQLGKIITENFSKEIVDAWPRTDPSNRHPNGQLRTNKETLNEFSRFPGIKELCEYKNYAKKISTYGDSLVAHLSPATKRIHSSYSLGYTDTDRLSSFEPNLQNIFVEGGFRRHFKNQYKKSWLIGGDYSQIEPKVLALYSKDPEMLNIFRNKEDLYVSLMAKVLGVKPSKVTAEYRSVGKVLILGMMYGMGWRTVQRNIWTNVGLRLTDKEAQDIHSGLFEVFWKAKEWQDEQVSQGAATLISKTRFGMIRKLNEKNRYTVSLNNPIQGAAGEIMKRGIIRVDAAYRKRKLKARLVNTVHDEIDVESFEDDLKESRRILKTRMIRGFRDVFPDTMGIAHFVDIKVGRTWAEIK